jgi:hypothetical protein
MNHAWSPSFPSLGIEPCYFVHRIHICGLYIVICNEPVDVKGLFTRPISEANFALG